MLGNAQDSVVTSAPPTGYGVQGSVAWTQSQRDAEMERATLAARQKKALMEAMSTPALRTPTFTSAEQYLAHYKPMAAANTGGPGAGSPPPRRDVYVPEFNNSPVLTGRGEPSVSPRITAEAPQAPAPPAATGPRVAPAPATSRNDLPNAKRGLFSFGKKEGGVDASLLPAPPASSYPEAPVPSEPAPSMSVPAEIPASAPMVAPTESTPTARDAVAQATVGSGPEEKPGILGRLFNRDKETEPSFAPEPTLSAPPAPDVAALPPAPAASADIPSPPGFNAADPPQPAAPAAPVAMAPEAPALAPAVAPSSSAPTGGASIFVNRNSGTPAISTETVQYEVQASVGGVLVKLYKGNRVEVLEQQGRLTKVRLPDGREGTVAASSLGL